MKRKIVVAFFLFLSIFMINGINVKAVDKVNMYIFYGRECPHCAALEEAMVEIEEKYPYLNVIRYEVWHDTDNQELLGKVADEMGKNVTSVPFTIIGEKSISGFHEELAPPLIKKYIEDTKAMDSYDDPVAKVLKKQEAEEKKQNEEKTTENTDGMTISLPFVGKVDLSKLSVPFAAIILGILDGFNPCAMWILLFLISMLLGMENKKRMWTLGIAFLVTSAFVYMAFMMVWLKFISFMGAVSWIKMLIAAVALIGGYVNLRSYMRYDETGCEVVDEKKRKKILSRVKKFTGEKNFWLALIGVIALAASVNIVELSCSAGLPTIFIAILDANNVTGTTAFMYVLLYILFFMIDDLIVFIIAMKSLKLTGLSGKYGKFSHLIGGIIMIIIGILILFKPEWLMFNF